MSRLNGLEFWIGHNRTGKSVLLKDLGKSYKKSHNKKRVITYDPQSRFTDIADETIYKEDWAKYFSEDKSELYISDTMFILDDYRGLMGSDRLDEDFLAMLMKRNEHGLDFHFVCHSPKLILERISYYITHFNLFYTQGDRGDFLTSKKMASVETVVQCRDFVNRYVKDHTILDEHGETLVDGRGDWKADGKHTFPFLRIDNEKESIELINMPDAKVEGKKIIYNSKDQ